MSLLFPEGRGPARGIISLSRQKRDRKIASLLPTTPCEPALPMALPLSAFFSEPDGVVARATILRNTIEQSERGGLLFSASFGPSHNRFNIEAADNILRANGQFGISAITSIPLAERIPKDNALYALFATNEISNSPIGIMIQGGVGEAVRNAARIAVDRNRILHSTKNAIRILGGMGMDTGSPADNSITAALSRNFIEGGSSAIVLQGAAGASTSTPRDNSAAARITGNAISGEQAIAVSNGRPGNHVEITENSQPFTRTDRDLIL